jgi:hypothetical protein
MTTQVHDTGEEFAIKDLFRIDVLNKPANISVGLYHDGEVSGDTTNGDDLGDNDDVGAINTEPTGSSFARQTASFDSTDFTVQDNANENFEAIITDLVFDTSDSSQDIDAYFVVVNFQSSDTGDSSQNNHLYFTGPLDQLYDLNSVDQFTLQGAGLELD